MKLTGVTNLIVGARKVDYLHHAIFRNFIPTVLCWGYFIGEQTRYDSRCSLWVQALQWLGLYVWC
jgi:hypothetical protein